ncbi:hypothetical protein [Asticcacaulis taihuensis]|uniref:hypothetical protein n=1 Tax=Asticcacaulis taihuensis TaxID=260084 RepID=UPI003F7C4575
MYLNSFGNAYLDTASAPLNFKSLGQNINVPFHTWPLSKARLLWLNHRWFLERGINSHQHDIADTIAKTIMETFAVSSERRDNIAPKTLMSADRYGGTGGGMHGGSGRCGHVGQFNAKGIGQTPLVSATADIHHINGKMSLAEALREAVNAEIANFELPYGAVPVIAIIDTGEAFTIGDDPMVHRGAIIVRPNFVRPAHYERSIFFGDSGYAGSHQFIDALRVKDAVQATVAAPAIFPSLSEMFIRFSHQIGSARAKRLWQGQFLSSNLATDGALADFGSFRSVPNWRASVGLAGERFGSEMKQLRNALLSLAFYFVKYGGHAMESLDVRELLNACVRTENATFATTCLQGLGIYENTEGASQLEAALSEYYRLQQATRMADNVHENAGWLYHAFLPQQAAITGPVQEARLAGHIGDIYAGLIAGDNRDTASLNKARRFFRPQPLLHYSIASAKARYIEQAIVADRANASQLVGGYIRSQVAKHRRTWKHLPPYLDVVGQRSNSFVLQCINLKTKTPCNWVEGSRVEEQIVVAGRCYKTRDLPEPDASGSGWVGFMFDSSNPSPIFSDMR